MINRRSVRPVRWLVAIGLAGFAIGCGRTPQTVEEGHRLYRVNGCATCHGVEGHGDGPVAQTLGTRPRDFRDAQSFKRGREVNQIADTLKTGFGTDLGRMPGFGHLSEDERRAVAIYVISLARTSERGQHP